MSDVQSDADERSDESVPPQTAKGTSPLRLVILLLVFGIALTGLLYDRCVARPAHQEASDTIMALLEDRDIAPNSDGTVSDDRVQLELGREPAEIEQLPNGKTEIYSWRSGLPFRTYNLYVVYTGKKNPLLHFASTKRPTAAELPQQATIAKPLTQKELDEFTPLDPGANSGEGMAGGGRGGSRDSSGKKRTRRPGKSSAQQQDATQEDPTNKEIDPEPPTKEEPTKEEPTKEEPTKEEAAEEEPAKEAAKTTDPVKKADGE